MARKIRYLHASDVGIGPDRFVSKDGKRYTRTTTTKRGYGRGPYRNAIKLPVGLFRWTRGRK